jgi:hypothetical protein
MTARPVALVTAALWIAACSASSSNPAPPTGGTQGPGGGTGGRGGSSAGSGGAGSGGSGGATGASGGSGGSTAGGTGGGSGGSTAGATGGSGTGGNTTGGSGGATGGSSNGDGSRAGDGPGAEGPPSSGTGGSGGGAGGKALMIVGTIPLVGTDVQIRDALKARNLEVEEIKEAMATPELAAGKRIVILSCSMQSDNFKNNAAIGDVAVPIFVLEHNLLPGLGMTSASGHGFQQGLTQITITSDEPTLTAGLPMGDVTVYGKTQEMFWGVPGPGAIKVASIKGNAGRSAYFAYPKGAMMEGKMAPAARVHFFFAVHAPPPVTTLFLNDTGLKLLGGAIDWALK